MKPNFRMSILTALVVVLSFAGPPHSQAQRPDQPIPANDAAPDLERLRALASDGDADAQFRLGEAYERGQIVERDLAKAAKAYRQAAEQGHPDAQYALAHLYHMGSGVAQDMAAAMAWYREAARQGHEASQLALGDQYRIGLIVPRDLEGSTKWYRRAAEQGNIFAQYELANAYRYGHGLAPNATEAAGWYRRSAEGGNPAAHLALAELLGGEAGADRGATPPVDHLASAASRSFEGRQKVSALLARADRQIESLALTTPAGANAYETYQEVLSIDRDNSAALAGIEEIGVTYAELAGVAAAKGDLETSRKYAAKAAVLAPEHPTVLSMSLPQPAASPPASPPPEVAPLTVETLEEITEPRRAPETPEQGRAKIQMAIAARATTNLEDLVEDPDDLLFNPSEYQGRPVAVVGRMVDLFWNYRLIAEDGQNNMVVDVDGLDRAARDKLTAAFEQIGAFAPVRARIEGTIERQGFGTFQLAASEVTLAGFAPRRGDTGRPVRERGREAVGPVAVSVDSDRAFGQRNRNARRTRSGDRGGGNDGGGTGSGGGSDGSSGGGGSSSGGGSSGSSSGGGSGGDGGAGAGGGSDSGGAGSGGGNANGGNGGGRGDRDGGGRAGVGGNGGGDRDGGGGAGNGGGSAGNGGKGGDRG